MLDRSRQSSTHRTAARWRTLGLAVPLFAAHAGAAVLPVTTLLDVDLAEGHCSLREAIVAANTDAVYRDCPAGSGADEIELTLDGTVTLAADLPAVVDALTVRGRGVGRSILDAGGEHALFEFEGAPATATLRIERIELTGGSASSGGAVFVGAALALELEDCVLRGNAASGRGGAISAVDAERVSVVRCTLEGNVAGTSGGAIAFDDVLDASVVDSTLSGNLATFGQGGAIYGLGLDEIHVLRSTLVDNAAEANGGAVYLLDVGAGSAGRIELSTVAGNRADDDASGNGQGGGILVHGVTTVTLAATVLAGNIDASATGTLCPDGDVSSGGDFASEGFNLIGVNDCVASYFPAGLPNVGGDFVGTSGAPLDPLLGPLETNGGPTRTRLPLAGSPVVDRGGCPTEIADQRGFRNPVTGLRIVDDPAAPDFGDACDIGAVERLATDPAGLPFLDGFEAGDAGAWSSVVP